MAADSLLVREGVADCGMDVMMPSDSRLAYMAPFLVLTLTVALCAASEAVAQPLWLLYQLAPFFVMLRTASLLLRQQPHPESSGTCSRHIIILPCYKEPISIIQATLDQLSRHSGAQRTYIVVLAFEERELATAAGQAKLDKLMQEYGRRGEHFDLLLSSAHELTAHELPGKGSNVAGALRHVRAMAKLDTAACIVTVMDADCLLEAEYVQRATSRVLSSPEHTPVVTFPCMLFAPADVSPLVSGLDAAWQWLFLFQAVRAWPVCSPVSMYSMRLDVWLRVGVDSTPLGIGEDLMTMLRAATAANARSAFIPVPFTVRRCPTLWERLVQLDRHGHGSLCFAFALEQLYVRRSRAALWAFLCAAEVSISIGYSVYATLFMPFRFLNLYLLLATHAGFRLILFILQPRRGDTRRAVLSLLLDLCLIPLCLTIYAATMCWTQLRQMARGERAVKYRPALKAD